MEKPNMDRRGTAFGTGLLIIAWILPLLPAVPVWAQSPPGELRVLAETAPESPRSGDTWAITFLVNHPRPDEVEIRPPPFPALLSPDSVRVKTRLVENERWTEAEYRFILRESGRLELAPFEIVTPRGRTAYALPVLRIENPEGEGEFRVPLVWEHIPRRLRVGEALAFSLKILRPEPRHSVSPSALLIPEVPRGFILEAVKAEAGDREAGRVLRLRVIPLSAGELSLPAKTVRSGNLLLEIPPLRIPVVPAPASGETAGRP
jgi:hypothetical protein